MNQRYKQKDNNDKFYTKKEIAKKLLTELNLDNYDIIIEPSAGNGSFSLEIHNCIAIDISPEHPSIQEQDFFTFEFDFEDIHLKNILVVGNPPFGKQSNLAIKFFKKAATFANCIAFILPKSFKKASIQNKLPKKFHLIKEIDIPDNSFTLNGIDYAVPCVFQIWNKEYHNREIIDNKTSSVYFEFVNKKDNPSLCIRRVGFYAGKAYITWEDKSIQSHYFIKTKNKNLTVDKINSIKWIHDNTVGPRSISKPELIDAIENVMEK